MKRRPKQARLYPAVCLLLLPLVVTVAGCGSTSLPTAGGQYNTYAGTQNLLVGNPKGVIEGGVWSMSLDDTNSFFSYQDIYDSNLGTSIGNYTTVNGFLDMTLAGGTSGSGGYAIEMPGNAVALRPGSAAQYPIIGVGANSCQSPTANTTYQFLALTLGSPNANTPQFPAYGSIQATAQGTAWSFSNFNEYAVDGTSLSPAAIPSGACVYTAEGYAINIPVSDPPNYDVPDTVAVGPSGFFMADIGQSGYSTSSAKGALVGMARPSSPVSVSDIVAGKYAGFQYLPLQAEFNFSGQTYNLGSVTSPVSFGQTAGSGTVMTGGVYPSDNVSLTPASNITIDLGQQDAKNNGLFPSVTVTIPDTAGACISRPFGGKDANGNPTCILPAAAIVGNPGGKYAVYVIVSDERASVLNSSPAPIEFFLYQQ